MSLTAKLVKSTSFVIEGVDHVHYVLAYKGRVFNASSLNFEVGELEADEVSKTVKIKTDVVAVAQPYHDVISNKTINGYAFMPKFDVELAAF